MYLHTTEEGGETVFPRADRTLRQVARTMSQGRLVPYGVQAESSTDLACIMTETLKVPNPWIYQLASNVLWSLCIVSIRGLGGCAEGAKAASS